MFVEVRIALKCTSPWLLMGVLALGGLAHAASAPGWLAPAGPWPSAGAVVWSADGAPTVERPGTVNPVAGFPGLFSVVPGPGAPEVVVAHGGERQRVSVGPPAGEIRLRLASAAPVKGRDTEATLLVEVRDPQGQLDATCAPPVLRANVGTVEGLERTGPGQYRARYALPATRYPEVAVVVAFAAWPHPQSSDGAVGALRVPMASAVEVPGHTEPHAEMSLTIAGQTFGPVRADAQGSFRLPVVVPPGHGMAQGTAVDRLGNRRTVSFDLHLPRTDQLACVATPTRVPVGPDARAKVWCATSDPHGGVARGAQVRLAASQGEVKASRSVGEGIQEWQWWAPKRVAPGHVQVTALWRQAPALESREELVVEVAHGTALTARWSAAPAWAPAGGSWKGLVGVVGELGEPVAGVRGEVQGHPVLAGDAAGQLPLHVELPGDAAWGPRAVTLQVVGPAGREPARLHAWAEQGRLMAAVTDLAGRLVPRQALSWQGAPVETGELGTVELGALADGVALLTHSVWPGLSLVVRVESGRAFPGNAPLARAQVSASFDVVPAQPVNVRVQAEPGGLRWWLEDAQGGVLDGREVVVRIGGEAQSHRSRGRTRAVLPPGTDVAITDEVSGAAWVGAAGGAP